MAHSLSSENYYTVHIPKVCPHHPPPLIHTSHVIQAQQTQPISEVPSEPTSTKPKVKRVHVMTDKRKEALAKCQAARIAKLQAKKEQAQQQE